MVDVPISDLSADVAGTYPSHETTMTLPVQRLSIGKGRQGFPGLTIFNLIRSTLRALMPLPSVDDSHGSTPLQGAWWTTDRVSGRAGLTNQIGLTIDTLFAHCESVL